MSVVKTLLPPSGSGIKSGFLSGDAGLLTHVEQVSPHRFGWLPHLHHGNVQSQPESLRARLFRISRNLTPAAGAMQQDKKTLAENEQDATARAEYLRLMTSISGRSPSFFDERP